VLALADSALTPQLHEGLVRLGTWMPFAKGAELLAYFTGTKVSASSVRRWSERAGQDLVAWEQAECERIERELPEAPAASGPMMASSDGAMVPVVGGEWVEVKTLAVGQVVERDGEARAEAMSYFSRHAEAEVFIRQALVETHRRGLERAEAVCAVCDGAQWNQSLIDYHLPDAVRILDFGHASEAITEAGAAAWGEGAPETEPWARRQRARLRSGEADGVLRAMKRLRGRAEQRAGPQAGTHVVDAVAYLEKRREQLRYDAFRAAGWPIGSGAVESANKLVVEARLKGSGMHWAVANVTPMVALRAAVCSGRTELMLEQIEESRSRRRWGRRRAATERRREARGGVQAATPPASAVLPEHPRLEHSPSTPRKDPAEHPWRKYPSVRTARNLSRRWAAPKI
jgi:hypothetical protein